MSNETFDMSAGKFYHPINRINIPTKLFVSKEYNIGVSNIEISGVKEYYKRLFDLIAASDDIQSSSTVFDSYMAELFSLGIKINGKKVGNYMRLLKGWLFDSNSKEGAVLKGWVENRFGLIPFYHKNVIPGMYSKEYYDYMQEKMDTKLNKNLMYTQLDLVYTYTQTIIHTFFKQYIPKVTLYRGVNGLDEHMVIEKYAKRKLCIEQNSLVSFTLDKQIAESFGDTILKVEVPYTKILFFSEAMPTRSFAGEMEYLVIGGRYDTEIVF
jgi:NAD+--dinitrogen-reductase ADP-D-ribosyltransferase